MPAEPGFARRESNLQIAEHTDRRGHTGKPRFPALLAPRHRRHDPERLVPRGDLVRQRIVNRFEGDVLPAGEEADEVSALRRPVIANRPAQRRMARLQCVEDRALRRPLLGVEGDLSFDARKSPQVLRKH